MSPDSRCRARYATIRVLAAPQLTGDQPKTRFYGIFLRVGRWMRSITFLVVPSLMPTSQRPSTTPRPTSRFSPPGHAPRGCVAVRIWADRVVAGPADGRRVVLFGDRISVRIRTFTVLVIPATALRHWHGRRVGLGALSMKVPAGGVASSRAAAGGLRVPDYLLASVAAGDSWLGLSWRWLFG